MNINKHIIQKKLLAAVYMFVLIGCMNVKYANPDSQKAVYPYEGSFNDELTVGETWVFEHHGVLSSGNIGQPAEGDLTQKVVSTVDQNDKKLWIMKETWNVKDIEPQRYFLDEKRFIYQAENGAEVFCLNPPIQMSLYNLEQGKDYEWSTIEESSLQNFEVTIRANRLFDETLQIPAGEFQDCQKVKMVLSFEHPEFPGQTIELHYMLWYHPKANGMVKESFKVTPPTKDGQYQAPLTGVSLLKSYSPK